VLTINRPVGRRVDYQIEGDKFEGLLQISMLIEALLGMTPSGIDNGTTLERREAMAGLSLQLRALLIAFREDLNEVTLQRAGLALNGIHKYLHHFVQAAGVSVNDHQLVRAQAYFDVDWSPWLAYAYGR
jgi:hypothetical protein